MQCINAASHRTASGSLEENGYKNESSPVARDDKGTRGRTVTLKVKFADFELISRSRTLVGAVGSRSEFENVSTELLKALFPMQKAVRLLGVSISGFKFDEIRGIEQIALAL